MKSLTRRLILLFGVVLAFSVNARASHLVGGSLGYEYIGDVGGGNFRYVITLVVYNNCDSTSNVPLPVATHPIAIYEHDLNGSPMGGGNKVLFQEITIPLVDSNLVEPPTVSGCAIGGNVCIYKGVYRDTIDLPLNFNGYHLYFQNFARNNTIDNLLNPGGTAMGFHAYIPSNLVDNSSPVFTDDPVPFLCVGDTTSILNTAIDPDGDLLVFSFVDAMAGTNGFAPPFPAPMPWPINPVTWLNGTYNANNPFGVGGYAFIDGSTGLTEYSSPNTGNFVVAVEVREFRNGNLIGVSRRDLQLLVINCPPNDAPNIDPSGTTQIQYSVEEGDNICFDIDFVDENGDTLTLDAGGSVFDISLVNPTATINVPVTADSIVTTQFCWNTACGQAQPLPYYFNVSVTDNGCPPKTTNEVYQVTVNPPASPTQITGPVQVCEGATESYTTDTIPGATYNWVATGGTIVSGQGTVGMDVQWGAAGPGLVEVSITSQFGCPSSSVALNVTILALPNADAGNDTTICLGDSAVLGGAPTGPLGATYTWTPAGSLNDATLDNPTATPAVTTDYIVSVDVGGTCFGTDTVTVTVPVVPIDAGNDTTICIGDTAQLQATGGVVYTWTPTGTLDDPNIDNPQADPTDTTTYFVTVSDGLGCVGTDSVTVNVAPLPNADAGPDTAICAGNNVVIGGAPTGPTGATYSWTPAADLTNATVANPTATPAVTPTTYTVVVTSVDGCVASDDATVTVNPLPIITIANDTAICPGDSAQLTASGGVTYVWSPNVGLSDFNAQNPMASPPTTTTYTVTVTDANGCSDFDQITVTVHPTATADAGADLAICIGDTIAIGGSPTADPGATVVWSPALTLDDPSLFNPDAFPTTTTQYFVNVTDANTCTNVDSMTLTVNALPVVDAGSDETICIGDSVQIGGAPTGPAGSTYAWTPATGLGDATDENPMASPAVTTTYTVTVTDPNGCVNVDSMVVTVNPLPIITVSNDTSICLGDSAQLTATGGVTYVWSPNNGLSDFNAQNPMASPNTTTTYTVAVTDANGCSDFEQVSVNIFPVANADAGSDLVICIGDTITIGGSPTADPGATVVWSPALTLDDPNLFNPDAFPTTTTQYFVNVTDANTCSNVDSMTVTVNPLPVVDAGGDSTICIGDSTQIGGAPTGPAGSTFTWSPATGLGNPTDANPMASPAVTTTYTVTVVDLNGCINVDSMVVIVNPLPTITVNNDTAICFGDSAQLTATGGVTYVWSPNVGLSNFNDQNPMASPLDTTTYTVTVTDANGCTDFAQTTVNIDTLPTPDAGPEIWLCAGDSAQLLATGGATYSWSPAGALNDPNIANPMSGATDTTQYIVTVFTAQGCALNDTMTLIVNDEPPIDAGQDTTICLGDTVQIGGSPSSVPGSTYSWTPAASLDDATLANPMASPTATTTYYLTAMNDTCTSIDSITVIVTQLPPASAGPDTAICIGDSIQLIASGGVSYVWTPALGLSNDSIFNPMASPSDTTDYIVTVTDGIGCMSMDTMTLTVNPLPTVDAGPDVEICVTDSAQLQATGGDIYVWSPTTGLNDPNVDNPMASPLDTTMYFVTVTDSNGCVNNDSMTVIVNLPPVVDAGPDQVICIGDSAGLQATGGISFVWTPATGLSNDSIADPMASPGATTMYTVFVTDTNGCNNIDSAMVTVNPLPPADAGPDLAICEGAEAHLLATGGVTYVWSPATGLDDPNIADPWASPTVTTTYVVTVTDTNGCVDTDTMTLTINPTPVADAGPDQSICRGDSAQLNATGGTIFQWTPATDITDAAIANPMVFPDTTTSYAVTVTDVNGCEASDTVVINIFRVQAWGDTAVCELDSTQIFADAPTAVSYSWSPTTGLSDPNVANPFVNITNSTTYTVTATDAAGCTDMADVTIDVIAAPSASFDVDAEPGCQGLELTLTNTSSGAVSYLWNFPNGETSTDMDPEVIIDFSSNYTVLLTAFNASGCSDTSTFSSNVLSFDDYFQIEIPNVFSPNNDGVNDRWEINVGEQLSDCIDLEIFNRWGQIMFISTGNNVVWDGYTSDGVQVPEGTYFYVMTINGMEQRGHITVIR